MKIRFNRLFDNRGSGLGVILYGIALLLILLFTTINIINSKVIENGYMSLTDAVQSASSGSVIHLLTSDRETTSAQKDIIGGKNEKGTQELYDIYLQLALGYLINRNQDAGTVSDSTVQTGEINNFIKLDHQKVVNSTLSLLSTAVSRSEKADKTSITNTNKYKIMMFFIEPYRDATDKKFFNIIAYGNGDWDFNNQSGNGDIDNALAIGIVENSGSMKSIYKRVEDSISSIVNGTYDCKRQAEIREKYSVNDSGDNFSINLNSQGVQNYDQLIRKMETYPHYVIVVKDFALPTIFDGVETNSAGNTIKKAFSLQEPRLSSPMCTLNTGNIQRQHEDAGWDAYKKK